jgi:uncharacterized membrane protein
MDRARKSYFYAGLAVLFWSTIPTVFKIGLGELDVLPMLTIATFTSTTALFFIVLFGKKWKLIPKTSRREQI